MFTLPMRESEHRCRVLIEDAEHKHFMAMIEYMYSGRLDLQDNTVMPILALANRYIVGSLMDLCERYTKWRLNPGNVCRHLVEAEGHQCDSMAAYALEYLAVHFDEVHHESSSSFELLSGDMVLRVLQHEGLTVDEETVFLAVDGWAKAWRRRSAQSAQVQNQEQMHSPLTWDQKNPRPLPLEPERPGAPEDVSATGKKMGQKETLERGGVAEGVVDGPQPSSVCRDVHVEEVSHRDVAGGKGQPITRSDNPVKGGEGDISAAESVSSGEIPDGQQSDGVGGREGGDRVETEEATGHGCGRGMFKVEGVGAGGAGISVGRGKGDGPTDADGALEPSLSNEQKWTWECPLVADEVGSTTVDNPCPTPSSVRDGVAGTMSVASGSVQVLPQEYHLGIPEDERLWVDRILQEVRFPLIATIFLIQVVEKSAVVAESSVMKQLLHEAYRFRAIQYDSNQINEQFPGNHRAKYRGDECVLFGEGEGCVGTVEDYSSSLSEVRMTQLMTLLAMFHEFVVL
ncbi:unnamed protein product [Discosporangium mesarthrocarpum]